jgi:protein TonB
MLRRYLIAGCFAGLVTFGLFFLMQSLIAMGGAALDEAIGGRVIDFVRLRRDESAEVRKRELPKREAQENQPAPPKMSLPTNTADAGGGLTAAIDIDAPQMDTQLNLTGGPHLGAAPSDADVIPLVRVNPQYPRNAAQNRTEGWVQIEFDISVTGTVRNPRVIAAQPPGIFDSAALAAIRKWKYKPKIENGIAVERHNIQVQLTFELEDAQ